MANQLEGRCTGRVASEISLGHYFVGARLIVLAADHFTNNANVVGRSHCTVCSTFYAPPCRCM